MVQAVKCIVDATELPVFADGDTGYGNALSVRRTMQEYEKAGEMCIRDRFQSLINVFL